MTTGVTDSLTVIPEAHSNTREKDDHGEFEQNQSRGVRNTSYPRTKKNRPDELRDEFDEAVHSRESPREGVEAKLVTQQESQRVRTALETLPTAFGEIPVLREVAGLSDKQISDVPGVLLGTVMSSLSRARERLREELSSPFETGLR